MRIADAMTRDVQLIHSAQSIFEAAQMMVDGDCGALPVAENGKLVGMITDRDIVVRVLARGKSPNTQIKEVMTTEVKYCFEEDDLNNAVHHMGDLQIRRLPVVNKDRHLVGIVSLGDIAVTDERLAAEALFEISEPASQDISTGQHLY